MGLNSNFAVVTGASSGIGFELARLCARQNFDLLIAADEEDIRDAAADLSVEGVSATPLVCDLSTRAGIDTLLRHVVASGRPVDCLFANAGLGLGGSAFLDQDIHNAMRVAHTNIDGTLYLLHAVGRAMRARGSGRILVTASSATVGPAPFQAVYGATEAFLNSFAIAFAHEMKGTGVTVTCLMPGPTDTAFFERAGMESTRVGAGGKADAADVARAGFDAMMKGQSGVISGFANRLRSAVTHLAPDDLLAQMNGLDAATQRRSAS